MKSKTKKLLLFGLIAVAIISLILYSPLRQEAFGGATVLSIDNARFVTSSSELNSQDAFLVNLVANQGGENLVGEITPEDIAKYGVKNIPAGPFKIYVNLKNVSCNYNIIDDDKPFYKIYQATYRGANVDSPNGCPWNEINLNSVKNNCKGTWTDAPGTETAAIGAPLTGGNCDDIIDIQKTPIRPELGMEASEWCYAQLPDRTGNQIHWRTTHIGGLPVARGYRIGDIATPDYQIEIIVENKDGKQEKTLLTPKDTVGLLSDIGRVKFVGSLVAQEFCGQPSIEKNIIKEVSTNSFRIVKRTDYEHYQDVLTELINFDNNEFAFQYVAPQPAPPRDPGVGAATLWDKMSTLNSVDRLLRTSVINDNCKINNLIYSCTPSKDVLYPELQIILKASWVGIQIAKGQPKITTTNIPLNMMSGDMNVIAITIQNTGTSDDSFDVKLNCDKPVSLGSVRTAIEKGASNTVNLNFLGNAGTYKCELVVNSVNDILARDVKNLLFTIQEKPFPETKNCASVPIQPCDKALWQGYPVCKWDTSNCQIIKKDYSMYVYIGIGIILVLIIVMYFLSRKNSGRIRKK